MKKKEVIGIMGAMPEETDRIVELLESCNIIEIGDRKYHSGTINNQEVVVVFSRWGKVAAAATATTLILRFNVSKIIFTGVAGAIDTQLNIGDIIVGQKFFQHDMDARPLMNEFEIPLLQKTYFESDADLSKLIYDKINQSDKQNWHIAESLNDKNVLQNTPPNIYLGDIASGDHFFADADSKTKLKQKLPSVSCVEMEGAAVAQVCYEFQIPFAVIRVISDSADGNSSLDFTLFIEHIAGKFSRQIVQCFLS